MSFSFDMEMFSNLFIESSISVYLDMLKKFGIEDKFGNLFKFGEWDRYSVNFGFCYMFLF